MKIQELRQLNRKKLIAELTKSRRELAVARFHVKTQQSQDTSKIKKTRRNIARVMTLLSQNEDSK